MSKLVTILGPTASGKTALSIALAKKFNGEIVCADSLTAYKEMDIGSAKPDKIEQQGIRHYLLDIVEPGKAFSVAEFKKLAEESITQIHRKGKLPFLVGGSGLYIDAVLFDYQFRDVGNNERDKYSEWSITELQAEVRKKYPDTILNNSEYNNSRRLAAILTSGLVKNDDRNTQKIDSLVLGIDIEMPVLKQNIAIRTKDMLNKGFIQEVKNIQKKYGCNCPQLQTVGYKEVLRFIEGNVPRSELEMQINTATYKLAKKQRTWFKRNPTIIWIKNYQEAERSISDYLGL